MISKTKRRKKSIRIVAMAIFLLSFFSLDSVNNTPKSALVSALSRCSCPSACPSWSASLNTLEGWNEGEGRHLYGQYRDICVMKYAVSAEAPAHLLARVAPDCALIPEALLPPLFCLVNPILVYIQR